MCDEWKKEEQTKQPNVFGTKCMCAANWKPVGLVAGYLF